MSLSNLISSDEIQKNLDTLWSSNSNESSQLPNELAYDKNVKTFTGDKRNVAIYAGKGAKTFPVLAAKEQRRLINEEKISPTEAYKKTGVFDYVDEQTNTVVESLNPQRFEIDDSLATFNPNAVWKMKKNDSNKVSLSLGNIGKSAKDIINKPKVTLGKAGLAAGLIPEESVIGGLMPYVRRGFNDEVIGLEQNNAISTLGEIFKHDKLFEAYPQFKDITVELTDTSHHDSDTKGELNEEAKEMDSFLGAWYPYSRKIVMNMKYFKGADSDNIKETLIHEIQHLADFEEMTDTEKLSYIGDKLRLQRSNVDLEASARDTERRMNLTKDERKIYVPFSSNFSNTINQKGFRDDLIKSGKMDSASYLGTDNINRRQFRDFVNKNKEESLTSDKFLNKYQYSDDSKKQFNVGFLAEIYNASDKELDSGLTEQAVWRKNFRELIPKSDIQIQNYRETEQIANGIIGRRDSKGSGKIKGTPFDVELNTLEENGYNLSKLIEVMPNILGAESSFGIAKNNPNNPNITGPMQIDFRTFQDSIKQGTLGPKYEQAVGLKKGTAKDMTLEEFTKFMNDPKTGLKNSVITAIGILLVKVKHDINKEKAVGNTISITADPISIMGENND